jgi:hypothetical protein
MEEYRYFAVLDCDNMVINTNVCPIEEVDENTAELIAQGFSSRYSGIEYSLDSTVTNNPASIGHIYDEQLNAFIPKCPGDGYILDTVNYVWCDPNLNEPTD